MQYLITFKSNFSQHWLCIFVQFTWELHSTCYMHILNVYIIIKSRVLNFFSFFTTLQAPSLSVFEASILIHYSCLRLTTMSLTLFFQAPLMQYSYQSYPMNNGLFCSIHPVKQQTCDCLARPSLSSSSSEMAWEKAGLRMHKWRMEHGLLRHYSADICS